MRTVSPIKIYLSGGMSSFGKENFHKSNKWRESIIKALSKYDKIQCFNPNTHATVFDTKGFESEREIMEYELRKLRQSDLVIYNHNDTFSMGSMAELTLAHELRIPILAINEEDKPMHPWMECFVDRVFNNEEECLFYFYENYLYYS